MNKVHSFIKLISNIKIFIFFLLWLIILLIFGTINQKDLGLYFAQQKYFSSFIIWLFNIIPLPGGYTTIMVIFINLSAKLILDKFSYRMIGTLIIHFGVLLLIAGAGLTAFFSYEGNMIIAEGEKSNYINDYHEVELVIADITNQAETIIKQNQLKSNNHITLPEIPFLIKINDFFKNIKLIQRKKILENDSVRGMAKAMEMNDAPLLKDNEYNIAGISFTLKSNHKEIEGLYFLFENMPIQQYIKVDSKQYLLEIRRKRTYLPFSIKLIEFNKTNYQKTYIAKNYSSKVIVIDNKVNWQSIIEMNNPLRYKGYTFYQSSFIDNNDQKITVLTVVKNIGKVFPYISSIIIAIGIFIHILLRINKSNVLAKV